MITQEEWIDFKRHPGYKELLRELHEHSENALSELASRTPSQADERRDFFLRGLLYVAAAVENLEPRIIEGDSDEQIQDQS